ncbi:hypothetical protein CROSSROADS_105 [Mycobacterium phage Crossroads]|nr:hypothetical protein N848_gp105 [Mycobacterium phage Crossroads]AGT13103.1 hypothetical protein CROSSROADS_105 [Mycobacterium phage Crossroads]ALY07425.1 hypothetical protein SEA_MKALIMITINIS3_105 [Mycobacterium phage MkaliMitinis3]
MPSASKVKRPCVACGKSVPTERFHKLYGRGWEKLFHVECAPEQS